jgi:hypothetical protein
MGRPGNGQIGTLGPAEHTTYSKVYDYGGSVTGMHVSVFLRLSLNKDGAQIRRHCKVHLSSVSTLTISTYSDVSLAGQGWTRGSQWREQTTARSYIPPAVIVSNVEVNALHLGLHRETAFPAFQHICLNLLSSLLHRYPTVMTVETAHPDNCDGRYRGSNISAVCLLWQCRLYLSPLPEQTKVNNGLVYI